MNFKKKILILGGANQHLKFVEAAKEMGLYTIVTDYLEDSPCKKVCDEALMLNITDVDGIVEYCKEHNVDGVVSGFLDPCQIPYSEICKRLNLPCYGTTEQFRKFTNKRLFKELCKKNGVGIITDYSEDDVWNDRVEYPVFVKPVDSRGSRGQSVCYSKNEMADAINFAKSQSSNGDFLIEQYMGDCDEVQITCFVINGKVYLERTCDSNRGTADLGLHKVVSCAISPSKHTKKYLENAHSSVCKMIEDLGYKNGPIFMQGFYKDGKFFFFDPGLRFPGVEFERIYKKVWGIDFAKLLIEYALNGTFPDGTTLPDDGAFLKGQVGAVLFPVIRKGTIAKIEGKREYEADDHVVAFLSRYDEGDTINWTYDVNQRYAEVDILGDNIDDLSSRIQKYYESVKITDEWGRDMYFDKFSSNRLPDWYTHEERNNDELSIKIITEADLIRSGCYNLPEAIAVTEKAFLKMAEDSVIFPDKVSVIFNEKSQNRINCLPAGIVKDNVYGMKWVSVFPGNPHKYGVQNLSAVILLSELQHGFPKAFMEGTLCSNLRTAATSAVAAKYLARNNCETIGFIGAGQQAKAHLMAMISMFPTIKECKVSSRTQATEDKFISQMSRLYPNVDFISCHSSYEKAARNSDIIVTCISGQEKILQGEWVSPGTLYCHVAGLEDDFSVAQKADKIVCDEWRVVKHRTQTISQMYKAGILKDEDIYCNLTDLVSGKKKGRTSDDEFIYFNSVGMSYVDIMLANYMYKKVLAAGLGTDVKLQDIDMFNVPERYITK